MDKERWTWPESLDALEAAPESHRLLFENDVVRVLEVSIGPDHTTPVHTHRWPAVLYLLSFGHSVRRDADGNVLVDTRDGGSLPESGSAIWIDPLPPHSLQNVDTSEIHLVALELKSA